ncbi:uncharacterized protein LOC122857792 [Aphidius gifuensis]|uniref:uncharacterized protein LOC122857792 n=1 Tax=Aphidius gifuensis TaxID=684658 RepID=UPI001CDC9D5A|nr:uncharacterized protein LOC122857792 [Aphidius gifuensis]XP_044016105.1 uncharacterized protein LOC122857792 [Aphidius gifuensis]
MVNCSVSGCRNSTRHGVKMNTVPRDENRRAQWIKNADLDTTKLNKTLLVCEYHFTADMWEKVRVDGKKKLKRSAIPTIFGELVTQVRYSSKDQPIKTLLQTPPQEPVKQIITIHDTSSNNIIIEEVTESVGNDGDDDSRVSTTEDTADVNLTDDEIDTPILPDENQPSHSDNKIDASILSEKKQLSHSELIQYVKKLEQNLEQSEKQVIKLKKNQQLLQNKLKYQLRKNKQLQARLNASSSDAVKQIFNNDQIQVMNGYKKSPQWSNSTIIKALKLRLTCGISGYKELIHHNHPLPSLRTLSRRLSARKEKTATPK